jgi:uncharacterized membrane protein YoaK (UPF0700 family)
MKLPVPTLLSFNAGYVDTAGFLALHGLFTSHVTGNFVTLGAAMALGTTGVLAKLLALPVFCAVVVLVRLIGRELPKHGIERFKSLLMIKVLLLALGGLLAILWGPFADGDAWRAILTGMVLVAAMAIQNAVQRVHLPKEPPTTIMTGNSTQMMIDFADLISGGLESDVRNATRARFGALARSVGAFAAGCAASAIIYVVASTSVFLLPPLIALAAALGAETRARQGA